MPRKPSDHSQLLLFFLKNHLPKNWKIKSLDGLTENEVYNNLYKSKILVISNFLKITFLIVEIVFAFNDNALAISLVFIPLANI